jgi:phospholipase C
VDVRGSTIIGDPDPAYDDCSSSDRVAVSGKNVGDLLNAKGITWGRFEGGFRSTGKDAKGNPVCGSSHKNVGGISVASAAIPSTN